MPGLLDGESPADRLPTLKTLKEIVIERKCRKGIAAGTTKLGAYWLACEPIKTRTAGGDGVGLNAPRVTYELHLRHFRAGEVRAAIRRDSWHQDGSNGATSQDWGEANAVLDCRTIEEVMVALKGTSLFNSPVIEDGAVGRDLTARLRELGLPDAERAPDDV
jgi:hypothetical protein